MSGLHHQINALKILYEAALEIVDEQNLYSTMRKIKKNDEGFEEYYSQILKSKSTIYEQWWIDLQQSFAKAGLNFLRFKKKMLLREDKDGYAIAPPGYLLHAIAELELMISNKAYLSNYLLSTKAKQVWPTIKYSKGVVDNGIEIHDFKRFDNKDAIQMLDRLWTGRQVISPTSAELKASIPISWNEVGFTNVGSGKSTANAINKAMREKRINLRVKFPRNSKGVFIRLQQKSTD